MRIIHHRCVHRKRSAPPVTVTTTVQYRRVPEHNAQPHWVSRDAYSGRQSFNSSALDTGLENNGDRAHQLLPCLNQVTAANHGLFGSLSLLSYKVLLCLKCHLARYAALPGLALSGLCMPPNILHMPLLTPPASAPGRPIIVLFSKTFDFFLGERLVRRQFAVFDTCFQTNPQTSANKPLAQVPRRD